MDLGFTNKVAIITGGSEGIGKAADLFSLAQLGFDIRRLGRKDMREFLRIIGINIFDVLEEQFESSLLKGALSFDAVLGTHLGPRSPNTDWSSRLREASSP